MKKTAVALLAVTQVLAVAGFWFWSHTWSSTGNLLMGDTPDRVLAWARLTGLLAG